MFFLYINGQPVQLNWIEKPFLLASVPGLHTNSLSLSLLVTPEHQLPAICPTPVLQHLQLHPNSKHSSHVQDVSRRTEFPPLGPFGRPPDRPRRCRVETRFSGRAWDPGLLSQGGVGGIKDGKVVGAIPVPFDFITPSKRYVNVICIDRYVYLYIDVSPQSLSFPLSSKFLFLVASF